MTAIEFGGDGLLAAAKRFVHGLLAVSRNSAAAIGLAVLLMTGLALAQPAWRHQLERQLAGWLAERHAQTALEADPAADATPDAAERATAADPGDLPKPQAALAFWLSKKYRVAPEPVSALVAEAFDLGRRTGLEPTLLLAVMAVESGFNPFAQSQMGAQGLMQVMTRVHTAKYENFGGKLAAFDPVSNLRVGAMVLHECVRRAGSVEAGLKHYVGAANTGDDSGYSAKVLAEQQRLVGVVANVQRLRQS
jgi:soluble lytic murein transglycosylase-like protein